MINELDKFKEVLESDEGKEIISLGHTIKKLDKSTDRKLKIVILLSLVSMTVLGLMSLGTIGGIIFFGITAISSFGLYYSSKKNVLLKYLTFYRSRIPTLISMAQGISVKVEEIPDSQFVSELCDGIKPVYRMCHNYDGLYMGYVKFMSGSNQILGGLIYFTEGEKELTEELKNKLNTEFENYTHKTNGENTILFIPNVETYLSGRVEMKDDLEEESLVKQYEYYLMGKTLAEQKGM